MLLLGIAMLFAAPAAAQQPDPAPPGSSGPAPDPAPRVPPVPTPSVPRFVVPTPTAAAPAAPRTSSPAEPTPTAAPPGPAPTAAPPTPTPRAKPAPAPRRRPAHRRTKPEARSGPVRIASVTPPLIAPSRFESRRIDDPDLRAAALALLVAAAGSLALVGPLRRGMVR
jgi:hypothetical protein